MCEYSSPRSKKSQLCWFCITAFTKNMVPHFPWTFVRVMLSSNQFMTLELGYILNGSYKVLTSQPFPTIQKAETTGQNCIVEILQNLHSWHLILRCPFLFTIPDVAPVASLAPKNQRKNQALPRAFAFFLQSSQKPQV